MTPLDLIVRGGTVVGNGRQARLDVGILNGRIAALLEPDTAAPADQTWDASGMVITPGGIDTHTHIDWPYDGQRTVDGVRGATEAALLGGTTTVIDFVPPAGPGQDLREACHDRADHLADGSAVDFALHPILPDASPSVIDALPDVIADGFTSFKMYTTYADRRVDDGAAWQLMQVIARHGGLPGFHAENHELLTSTLSEQVSLGQVGPDHYPASRPALAEAEAIQMVSLYARRIGVPVYIFHVSGGEALGAVQDARRAGTDIYAETCTHYLVHDNSVFEGEDPWRFVISPPIRGAADRAQLWRALRTGEITTVGSDHCAYSTSSKTANRSDHRHIPAGAPGIEARTPLLWSEGAHRHALTGPELAAASSERASSALQLRHKGHIEVGADADLVVWDTSAQWKGDDLVTSSAHTFSLYADVEGRGWPRDVLLRGKPVVTGGQLTDQHPRGRFIRRAPRH